MEQSGVRLSPGELARSVGRQLALARCVGEVPMRWTEADYLRFVSKVDFHAPNGCHEWRGYVMPNGYGQFGLGGSRKNGGGMRYAHRVSYAMHYSSGIPCGMSIDHRCRNRRCVNPAHLEAVTQRENNARSLLCPSTINRAKTHCSRGHAYNEKNTRWYGGKRECRPCCAMRQAAMREERRRNGH